MSHEEFIKIDDNGNLTARLCVVFFKEYEASEQITAYAPSLGTCTTGSSLEDAQQAFREVLEMEFRYMLKHKTLDSVLNKYKWSRVDHTFNNPEGQSFGELAPILEESVEVQLNAA